MNSTRIAVDTGSQRAEKLLGQHLGIIAYREEQRPKIPSGQPALWSACTEREHGSAHTDRCPGA